MLNQNSRSWASRRSSRLHRARVARLLKSCLKCSSTVRKLRLRRLFKVSEKNLTNSLRMKKHSRVESRRLRNTNRVIRSTKRVHQ